MVNPELATNPEIAHLEEIKKKIFEENQSSALNNFRGILPGGFLRRMAATSDLLHTSYPDMFNNRTPIQMFADVNEALLVTGRSLRVVEEYNHFIASDRRALPIFGNAAQRETFYKLLLENLNFQRTNNQKEMKSELTDIAFARYVFPAMVHLVHNRNYTVSELIT